MKSTTIILLAFIAGLVLMALVSPFIFFKQSDRYDRNRVELTGLSHEQNIDTFKTLNISGSGMITIRIDSTISTPRFVVDSALKNHVTTNLSSAGIMELNFEGPDREPIDNESTYETMTKDLPSTLLVYLPAGMLDTLELSGMNLMINLDHFSGPLTLNPVETYNEVYFRGCSITKLTYIDHLADYLTTGLIFGDTRVDSLYIETGKSYKEYDGSIKLSLNETSFIDDINLGQNARFFYADSKGNIGSLTLRPTHVDEERNMRFNFDIPSSTRILLAD